MIPNTIHYIWLSEEPLNEIAWLCLKSWKKKAPNFEIRKWTMKDFDLSVLPVYVREAIKKKKWAFACDYLRLLILYQEGGWYLDSDVFMIESPEEFKNNLFVSSK